MNRSVSLDRLIRPCSCEWHRQLLLSPPLVQLPSYAAHPPGSIIFLSRFATSWSQEYLWISKLLRLYLQRPLLLSASGDRVPRIHAVASSDQQYLFLSV